MNTDNLLHLCGVNDNNIIEPTIIFCKLSELSGFYEKKYEKKPLIECGYKFMKKFGGEKGTIINQIEIKVGDKVRFEICYACQGTGTIIAINGDTAFVQPDSEYIDLASLKKIERDI